MSKEKLMLTSKVINRISVFFAIGAVVFSMFLTSENALSWDLSLYALAIAGGTGLIKFLLSHEENGLPSKQAVGILMGGIVLSLSLIFVVFIFSK